MTARVLWVILSRALTGRLARVVDAASRENSRGLVVDDEGLADRVGLLHSRSGTG